jgi:hypothetical protein
MSLNRYARRSDTTQSLIVEALRTAGWSVWVVGRPVDLLCWKAGVFRLLEIKTAYGKKKPKARIDKRQDEQNEFIALTGTPVVCTPAAALLALGEKLW